MEVQEMKRIIVSELKAEKRYSKQLEDFLIKLLGIVDAKTKEGATFDEIRTSVRDFFVKEVESQ
jgi:hypothetical protein